MDGLDSFASISSTIDMPVQRKLALVHNEIDFMCLQTEIHMWTLHATSRRREERARPVIWLNEISWAYSRTHTKQQQTNDGNNKLQRAESSNENNTNVKWK